MKSILILIACFVSTACGQSRESRVCDGIQTLVNVEGENIYFGIENNTKEILTIPELRGISGGSSAFIIRKDGVEIIPALSASIKPQENSFMFPPRARYFIWIDKYFAEKLLRIPKGCGKYEVEFQYPSNVESRDNVNVSACPVSLNVCI